MYYKKAKNLSFIIAFVMILQILMPMNFAFADPTQGQEDIINIVGEIVEEDNDVKDKPEESEGEEDVTEEDPELETDREPLGKEDETDGEPQVDEDGTEEGIKEETQGEETDGKTDEKTDEELMYEPLGEGNGMDLGDIFTKVELIVKVDNDDNNDIDIDVENEKDVTIEIGNETRVLLTFDWEIDDGVELKDGDYAEIQIPKAFDILREQDASGDLKFGTKIIGTYEINEEGILKVVFNEVLNSPEYSSDRNGQVGLSLKFDEKVINDDNQQEIKFGVPISKTFIITIKPKGEQDAIEKEGAPNANINPSHINWVIDVNKNFTELDNAKVEDTIPEGLKLDGPIEVYKLTIGADGLEKGEEQLTNGYTTTEENNKFTVELGEINSAYRLKYKTTIDYETEVDSYKNEAILCDGNENKGSDSVEIDKITRESVVEKSGDENPELDATKITWTIDINKAQSNLSNVVLEDELPDGLTVDKSTIKIYELNPSVEDWVIGSEVTSGFTIDTTTDEGENKFSINFGSIVVDGKAYRIVFDTDIDNDKFVDANGKFIYSVDFKNEAILKTSEDGSKPTEIDRDSDEVTIKRSSLIEKSGKEVTNYDEPMMEWEVVINKAKQTIYGAIFEDKIGTGQVLLKDTIQILNSTGTDVTDDYTVNTTEINDLTFSINFGEISDTFKIVYQTKITGEPNTQEPNKGYYTNKAWLKGWLTKGGGDGGGGPAPILEEFEGKAKPNKFNSYSKSYVGIDYAKQTISWKITVDAIKEEITDLTITDYFGKYDAQQKSDKSMVFIENSLVVKKGTTTLTTLTKGTDYTLDYKGADGFVLTFKETALGKAKYEITFKTSFDPDVVLDNQGDINDSRNYKNNAHFDITKKNVSGGTDNITVDRQVSRDIIETIFNGGKKVGSIPDRADRKINWKIYANALGQDLTGDTPFVISDTIQDGQVFDGESTSVVVRKFSLSPSGGYVDSTSDADKFTEGTEGDYTFAWDEDNKTFTITFEGGVDEPILVEFTTDIVGISKAEYTNEAKVTGKDLEKTYDGKVPYSDHNKFIDKKAANADGNNVYVDDELEWEVTLNKSLSDIGNAVFSDTISAGQVYLDGSLELFKGTENIPIIGVDVEPEEDKAFKYTIAKNDAEGTTTLTLNLGDISDEYTVKYTTVVIAKKDETISNSAILTGTDFVDGKTSEKEYTATQSSWGTGSGKPRGSIEITKLDAETKETIANNPAKFELYYYLNGDTSQEYIVTGTAQSTLDGKIQYGNLPYRTYYLREVEAPTGYVLTEGEPIEIVVDGSQNKKDVKITVKNTKEKTEITANKKWVNGENNRPDSIDLQLYRNGDAYEAPVKLEKVDTQIIWVGLDKTDIDGEDYIYSVKEVDADGNDFTPANYTKVEDGLTITNTYVIPKEGVAKATKEWEDGPSSKPTVWFKLYRNIHNKDLEAVPDAEIKELANGTTEVEWTGLAQTDIDGNQYIFSVKEVDTEGKGFTPENYIKIENGLKVTNSYVSPTNASAKAIKEWVNGPASRPTVWFKLYRQTDGGQLEEVPVGEAPIKELKSGITQVSWTGLTKTDTNGNEYIFLVKEVDSEGNKFVPENYEKSEEGLTVTNTYVIPKTDVTGTKVWVGGPSRKPTIELQLYRDGEEHGNPVTLENGETQYTWTNLDKTDIDGNEYDYSVDEVNVPSRYRKSISEDGLTITNRYRPSRPEDPDPEDPETPEVPEEPETPEGPEDPETPEEPEEPGIVPGEEYGSILINKLDLDSNPLEGAEFTLYNASGIAIKTVTSDENGTVAFNNLALGIYTIKETKAPEGYQLFDDDLLLDIKDASTLKYNFGNVPEGVEIDDPDIPLGWEPIDDPDVPTGTLPSTGSIFGPFVLMILGMVMMVTGIGIIFKRRFS